MTPDTAGTFNQTAASATTSTVYTSSIYFITIQMTTVLPIGSYIRITLPSEISDKDASSNDIFNSVVVSSTLNTPTVSETGLSSSPQYFELTNIVTSSSNYVSRGSAIFIQITSLLNPPSTATSGSFSVSFYDSSNNEYETQTTGMTITATAGSLAEGTSPTLSASSTAVLDSVNFSFSLQAGTAIQTGSAGSVVVTFPSEFTLTAGT